MTNEQRETVSYAIGVFDCMSGFLRTLDSKGLALSSQMNSAAEMLQEMLDVDRQQGEDVQGG